jgi:general secretion pathway protein G
MKDLSGRKSEGAFTFVELMAAIAIILLLATMAGSFARVQIKRSRETELRRDLRMMREAIDSYKNFSDRGMIPVKADSFGYPPDLKALVEGIPVRGNANAKYRFLRKIPLDPMTGKADWGVRSEQDDPDSRGGGGENVLDVFSRKPGRGRDGDC